MSRRWSTQRRHFWPHSRRTVARLPLAALGLSILIALLAGCGTQGYAATLSKPVSATFATAQGRHVGSATLAPFYGLHAVVYYKNTLLTYSGSPLPVELRRSSCLGPIVATLTKAQAQPLPTSAAAIVTQADPTRGMDSSIQASSDLWIVVRAHADDAQAPLLACGQPLSGRAQYFDLFPPSVGSGGTAIGLGFMEEIDATHAQITLSSPVNTAMDWAVRDGCAGSILASGQIAPGATQASADIFRTLDAKRWRVTLTQAGQSAPLCQPLS